VNREELPGASRNDEAVGVAIVMHDGAAQNRG
jgi:hypothetical protein